MELKHPPLIFSALFITAISLTGCGSDSDDDDKVTAPDYRDVDTDGDGLIEITTLEELDWIRNNLSGTSLTDYDGYEYSGGCPADGCIGYELANDLDFNTNGDDMITADDDYYDYDGDGSDAGWLPIGSSSSPFVAVFEGNNFTINHLYSSRSDYMGLFRTIGSSESNAEVRNLNIENVNLTAPSDDPDIGPLTTKLINSTVTNIYTSGTISGLEESAYVAGVISDSRSSELTGLSSSVTITGGSSAGGLVNYMDGSTLTQSSFSGSITLTGTDDNGSGIRAGGIARYALDNSSLSEIYFDGTISATDSDGSHAAGITVSLDTSGINDCYSTGTVSGSSYSAGVSANLDGSTISRCYVSGAVSVASNETGGLAGGRSTVISDSEEIKSDIIDSYWATDTTGQSTAAENTDNITSATGLTETELKCPTSPGDDSCNGSPYSNWSSEVWNFGTENDLPILVNVLPAL